MGAAASGYETTCAPACNPTCSLLPRSFLVSARGVGPEPNSALPSATRRQLALVADLLSRKVKIDLQGKTGITALMLAACEGHVDVVDA